MLILLAACFPSADKDSGTDSAEPATCDDLVAEVDAELSAIQTCSQDAQCGQPLTGTSCGGTRDKVARTDADPTAFYAALDAATAEECDAGMVSTCDLPATYGFQCDTDGACAWDYAPGTFLPTCRESRGATYAASNVAISGDQLTLHVGYSGGCDTHSFSLCWPDESFMESSPVQVNLEIHHESNGDGCEAYLEEDISLDLSPLKAAYEAGYGTSTGTIVVHVAGETLEYVF